jgi:hypothetical protein
MVVINDVMAYMFGFFLGRTPLIQLSPKKTWEVCKPIFLDRNIDSLQPLLGTRFFGPPGSGSISQRYGSGSGSGSFPFSHYKLFSITQNFNKKLNFLTEDNMPEGKLKEKNMKFFFCILKGTVAPA